MKRISAVIIGLLIATGAVSAAGAAHAATWEEQHADKSFIALLEEHVTVLGDDWSCEVTDHMIVKIQKDDAKALGEIPITYNKSREEIKEVEAFVITPDGKKHPYTKMQEMTVFDDSPMYSDYMQKIVTLPQVSVGSVIEWKCRRIVKELAIKGQYWGFVSLPGAPTKKFRDVFTFPAGKEIAYRNYKDALEPKIEKTADTVTYAFEYVETDEDDSEEYAPPFYEIIGFSMFSSVKDWAVIADWYRGLIQKNTRPDKAIEDTVRELVKGRPTQADKVRAIFEYLQDNFRYVSMSLGDNMMEPHPTTEVFANRYGDCKDQCILARQMLELAGIQADIALFCGEFDGSPRNGLPSTDYFNHVLLSVTIDGARHILDPLLKGYDIGDFYPDYEAGTLFIITGDSYRFEEMPVGDEREHYERKDSVDTIQKDGSVIREVRSLWDLEFSLQMKESWKASSDKEKEEFYQSLDELYTKGGAVTERSWEGVDSRYGQIRSYLKFTSPKEYPVINDMILINESAEGREEGFSKKDRKYPIYFPVNSLSDYSTTYHVPDGYRVDFVPKDYMLTMPFLETSKTFTVAGNTVTVTSFTRTRRATVDPKRYQEVKDYFNALAQNTDQYIVLKKIVQDK